MNIEEQDSNIALVYRCKTTKIKLAKNINNIIERIREYILNENGIITGFPFIIYYNNEKLLDISIGLAIKEKITENEIYKVINTDAGNALVCTHNGSYIWLGKTYKKMESYIKDNKLVPINLAYEYYLNSPKQVKTKELKTKVVLYIK